MDAPSIKNIIKILWTYFLALVLPFLEPLLSSSSVSSKFKVGCGVSAKIVEISLYVSCNDISGTETDAACKQLILTVIYLYAKKLLPLIEI